MDKRGGGRGRREGVSRFSVKNFLSQSAEKFRRITLLRCVSENFRQSKSLRIRRGRGGRNFKIFRQKFCLTVPKVFVGEPLSVSLFSGIKKC